MAAMARISPIENVTTVCDATDPTLPIYFHFSVPEPNRKTEGFDGSVAVPLNRQLWLYAIRMGRSMDIKPFPP